MNQHAELIAKLRYMARQYTAGQSARGGNPPAKHYLDEAADALSRLTAGDVTLPSATVTISGDGQPFAGNWYNINRLKDYGDRRAAAAVLAERERCAKVCQDMKRDCGEPDSMQASLNRQMMSCADAIRKGTS